MPPSLAKSPTFLKKLIDSLDSKLRNAMRPHMYDTFNMKMMEHSKAIETVDDGVDVFLHVTWGSSIVGMTPIDTIMFLALKSLSETTYPISKVSGS